jgi:hypothetical protein
MLFASDPPLVKIILCDLTFKASAICRRDFSIIARAFCPYLWILDGLPKCALATVCIKANTFESIGVVAL